MDRRGGGTSGASALWAMTGGVLLLSKPRAKALLCAGLTAGIRGWTWSWNALGRCGRSTERRVVIDCESLLGLVRPERNFGGLLPPERDFGGLVLPDRICSSGLAGNLGRSDRRSPVGLISRLKRGE